MANYNIKGEFDAYAPVRKAFNVTPSPTTLLKIRAIMVSVETTVTGVLVGDTVSHTTHTLLPGIMYPFAFRKITAVASGTVKAYY